MSSVFQSVALQLIRRQRLALDRGERLSANPKEILRAHREPIMLATVADLRKAAEDVHPNPSPAQIDSGVYRKGHFSWKGIPIAIEVAKGGYRRGISKDGTAWERRIPRAHYGYIKRTEANDGDALDCFLCDGTGPGEHLDSDVVFVVNQHKPNGDFDEHKVVLGCASKDAAKAVYLSAYPDGWKCGPITAMTVPQFKAWLKNGDTSRPVMMLATGQPQAKSAPIDHGTKSTQLLAYLDTLIDAKAGIDPKVSHEAADELHGMLSPAEAVQADQQAKMLATVYTLDTSKGQFPAEHFSEQSKTGKFWHNQAKVRGINPRALHALARQMHEEKGIHPKEAYREAAAELEPETPTGLTHKKQPQQQPAAKPQLPAGTALPSPQPLKPVPTPQPKPQGGPAPSPQQSPVAPKPPAVLRPQAPEGQKYQPGMQPPTAPQSEQPAPAASAPQQASASGGSPWTRLAPGQKSPISGRTIKSPNAWWDPVRQRLVYADRAPHPHESSEQEQGGQGQASPSKADLSQVPNDATHRRANELTNKIMRHVLNPDENEAPTQEHYNELVSLAPKLHQAARVNIRNQILGSFGEGAAHKEMLANALREHVKQKIRAMGDQSHNPIVAARGSALGKDELHVQRQSGEWERLHGPSLDAVTHAAERVNKAQTPEEKKAAAEDLVHIAKAHAEAKQKAAAPEAEAARDAVMDQMRRNGEELEGHKMPPPPKAPPPPPVTPETPNMDKVKPNPLGNQQQSSQPHGPLPEGGQTSLRDLQEQQNRFTPVEGNGGEVSVEKPEESADEGVFAPENKPAEAADINEVLKPKEQPAPEEAAKGKEEPAKKQKEESFAKLVKQQAREHRKVVNEQIDKHNAMLKHARDRINLGVPNNKKLLPGNPNELDDWKGLTDFEDIAHSMGTYSHREHFGDAANGNYPQHLWNMLTSPPKRKITQAEAEREALDRFKEDAAAGGHPENIYTALHQHAQKTREQLRDHVREAESELQQELDDAKQHASEPDIDAAVRSGEEAANAAEPAEALGDDSGAAWDSERGEFDDSGLGGDFDFNPAEFDSGGVEQPQEEEEAKPVAPQEAVKPALSTEESSLADNLAESWRKSMSDEGGQLTGGRRSTGTRGHTVQQNEPQDFDALAEQLGQMPKEKAQAIWQQAFGNQPEMKDKFESTIQHGQDRKTNRERREKEQGEAEAKRKADLAEQIERDNKKGLESHRKAAAEAEQIRQRVEAERKARAEASKNAPKAKEPHEVTQAEWIDKQGGSATSHKKFVQAAVKAGKPVAPEVLKDYPTLKPKTAPANPPTAWQLADEIARQHKQLLASNPASGVSPHAVEIPRLRQAIREKYGDDVADKPFDDAVWHLFQNQKAHPVQRDSRANAHPDDIQKPALMDDPLGDPNHKRHFGYLHMEHPEDKPKPVEVQTTKPEKAPVDQLMQQREAEFAKEKANATGAEQQHRGPAAEHPQGDRSWEKAEAGGSDRLQRPAEGGVQTASPQEAAAQDFVSRYLEANPEASLGKVKFIAGQHWYDDEAAQSFDTPEDFQKAVEAEYGKRRPERRAHQNIGTRASKLLEDINRVQQENPHAAHHAKIDAWLSHESNAHLPAEKKEQIGRALKTATSRMPAKAVGMAMQNMSAPAQFYPSVEHLTEGYNEESKRLGEPEVKDGTVAGFYELHRDGKGQLHLDYSKNDDESDAIWTHAHEMHHAIDGHDKYSGHPEWQAAWRREIRRSLDLPEDQHPLTYYASGRANEGFAEFGAACVADPETMRQMFPRCYAYFAKHGLVGDGGQAASVPEVKPGDDAERRPMIQNGQSAGKKLHGVSKEAWSASDILAKWADPEAEDSKEYTDPAREARRSAAAAAKTAERGDHALAREYHKDAAYHHETAAEGHRGYSGRDFRHEEAAKAHLRAARRHQKQADLLASKPNSELRAHIADTHPDVAKAVEDMTPDKLRELEEHIARVKAAKKPAKPQAESPSGPQIDEHAKTVRDAITEAEGWYRQHGEFYPAEKIRALTDQLAKLPVPEVIAIAKKAGVVLTDRDRSKTAALQRISRILNASKSAFEQTSH